VIGVNRPAISGALFSIIFLNFDCPTTAFPPPIHLRQAGVTHTIPVYDGFALPHCIKKLNLAGQEVDAPKEGENNYSDTLEVT
jgi:hypothetical protein